jgi:ATP-dependent DNA ligase
MASGYLTDMLVVRADGDDAVFDALHRRGRVTDAILQAFDLLELDGEDLRPLPLGQRKPLLARLLARVQRSRSTSTPMPGESWCSGRPA